MSQPPETAPGQSAVPGTRVSGRRRRRMWFGAPPPRPLTLSGWALLPLRAFLGFTFCFAGLQKLANPNFFDANSSSSIRAQLIASIRISPLHQLLGHLLPYAAPIGLTIALAELAVGLGTLLGLWARVAAVGGFVLALTLFLTVSFHSSPYYTGADIVFVFAWIPLVLAGSGGVLSLDGVIAAQVAGEHDLGSPTVVPVRFSLVQAVCGHYEDDRCAAQGRQPCSVRGCPFLVARPPLAPRPVAASRGLNEVDRRTVVLGAAAAVAAAVVGGVVAGATAVAGRVAGGAKGAGGETVTLAPGHPGTSTTTRPGSPTTTSTSTPSTTQPAGTRIGPAGDVPVGGAARFTDPKSGDPGLVIQLTQGRFVAYDAVCPHAGCTVGYSSGAGLIVCPCHGSEFDPGTGAVVNPPATRGLTPIEVAVDASGELVVESGAPAGDVARS